MPAPKKPDYRGISTIITPTRIIDGDTIVADWLGEEIRIRLDDCWVADGTELDDRAADYLRQFFGKPLQAVLRTDVDENGSPVSESIGPMMRIMKRTTFARFLAWLWDPQGDETVNEAIVRYGWGTTEKPKQ
jgi:hypothetical protein